MLLNWLRNTAKESKYLDFMKPYGISPLKFGFITVIWKILIFGFGIFAVLNKNLNTVVWLILLLMPDFGLYFNIKATKAAFEEFITPLTNVVHSYGMIVEAKPVYRTIFGYNKPISAPEFKIIRINGDQEVRITFYPNGCRNPEVDLLKAMQHEFSSYTVIKTDNRPKSYLLVKNHKGRKMTNDDFLN